MQFADFLHHRLVDGEPARGIDDQHIVVMSARVLQRPLRDINRLLAFGDGVKINLDLSRQHFQLLDGRRTVDVATRQQHLLFLFDTQPARQLARRRRFAGALQTRHQDNRRRLHREVERFIVLAHQRHQFAVHDTDQGLARRQATDHLFTHGFFADAVDERLHHGQRNVGLKQRHAHFAQRVLGVGFGQPRFAAQRLDDARQTAGQVVEHGLR